MGKGASCAEGSRISSKPQVAGLLSHSRGEPIHAIIDVLRPYPQARPGAHRLCPDQEYDTRQGKQAVALNAATDVENEQTAFPEHFYVKGRPGRSGPRPMKEALAAWHGAFPRAVIRYDHIDMKFWARLATSMSGSSSTTADEVC